MIIDIHSKRKFRKKYLVTEGTVIVTEGTLTVTEGTVIGNRGEHCNRGDSNRGDCKYIASATTYRVVPLSSPNLNY